MHKMKLQPKYFNLIKNGMKNIELRLFDKKRQKIEINDEIIFSDITNPVDNIKVKVTNLYIAENFSELCKKIDYKKAGFESEIELTTTLAEFYPIAQQNENNVVGIEIILP